MIEISISRELATEHPAFIADCVAEGREVRVFDPSAAADSLEQPSAPADEPGAPEGRSGDVWGGR